MFKRKRKRQKIPWWLIRADARKDAWAHRLGAYLQTKLDRLSRRQIAIILILILLALLIANTLILLRAFNIGIHQLK